MHLIVIHIVRIVTKRDGEREREIQDFNVKTKLL